MRFDLADGDERGGEPSGRDATWRGAAPAAPLTTQPADWGRCGLRAGAAAVWTGVMLAAFLALRGGEIACAAVRRAPPPRLSPSAVQVWAAGALALLGLRLRVLGAPTERPGVVVANHASWIDVVALQRATSANFVAKAEVARWPGIGVVARTVGTSFVERRPVEAGRQSAALLARLARGDRLAIFPEGTSTDGSQVLPFKSALFAALFAPEVRDVLWVQPVSLVYRAPPGLPAAFYAWWGDMGFGAHLLSVLALSRGGEVQVRFHPPLRVADFPDRKALAQATGAAVRAGHAAGRALLGGR